MNRRKAMSAMGTAFLAPIGFEAAFGQEQQPRRQFSREGAQKRLAIVRDAGIRSTAANGPKVGEPAPDFALQPIKFYDFKTEDAEITQENAGQLYEPVRLSDFKGKRPVVLIFGSYT